MSLRIAVTGASGLLGARVAREARSRGHDVAALDRAALDVTDAERVRAAMEAYGPDAVIHCAAYTAVDRAEAEPERARSVNVEGTRNLARSAAAVGALMVYPSTDYVFDGRKSTPYLPDDPPNPLSVYGHTKLEGEHAVTEAGCDALVVRTSWLYGAGKGFVPGILGLAAGAGPLRVVDDQTGRPAWVGNAAPLVLALVERGERGVWHLADGGECTRLELAREALRLRGEPIEIEAISTEEFGAAAARPPYSVLDLTRTERALGRAMMDWREALRRFLDEEYATGSEG